MNLDIPKMGFFILVKQPDKDGFVGREIYKAQRKKGFSEEDSHYTHVEVSGGGPYSVCVAPPKTSVVDIRQQYKGRAIRIMAYKAMNYGYNRKSSKVAFWAASHCNLKYDWYGVIAIWVRGVLRKLIDHKESAYFCSENCLWALQKEYSGALGIQPHECMPAHFLDPKWFIKVWEGKVD